MEWTPDAVNNLLWTAGKVFIFVIIVIGLFGNPFSRDKGE